MKKVIFAVLFLVFICAGFYVGSSDTTYVHKFLSGPGSRFPANSSIKGLSDFWKSGEFGTLEADGEIYKTYFSSGDETLDLCRAFPRVNTFKMSFVADASVSDDPVSMSVIVGCDLGGAGKAAPLFVKSFCTQPLAFYRTSKSFLNSTFIFKNILDGFPKLWFADSIEPIDLEGNSIVGIRPSQEDVTVDGKFTINCLDF